MTPELVLLLSLLPLSIGAGVDLYLTLLFLGIATRLGWETPPPGALGDLGAPMVVLAALLLYVLELWAERRALPSLLWNAVHTVVRPLAGALLALLALTGLPPGARFAAAVAAGALALAAHVTRSGWGLLLGLIQATPRVRLLVSLAEDVGVLALLSLLLDVPLAAAGLALFAVAVGVSGGRSSAGAFAFALALVWNAAWAVIREGRWHGPERFPRWIRRALDDPSLAPGGGLRGSPAGAVELEGLGLFRAGWVVVRGGSPLFLYRDRRRTRAVDLGSARPVGVTPSALHTRVELAGAGGRPCALYFSLEGPRPEDLHAEFLG